MKKKLLILTLGLLTVWQFPLQAQQPPEALRQRYDLRALPWANLFYQLDCLADQGYCSRQTYQELWQGLNWSQQDQALLARWKALKSAYQYQVQFPMPTEPLPLPPRFEGFRLWDKIRQASLNAKTRHELALNLGLLMQAQDAEHLLAILEHFEPRFNSWWQSAGQSLSESGALAFADLLSQQHLPDLLEQAAIFYGAELSPQTVLSFNFIARPHSHENNSHGEQIESQSLIEVLAGKPASSLDVVVHELCHYLYRRSSREQEARLIRWFASQPGPEAIVAFNLLNEVLATSIGNGLVNQWLMPEDSFKRYLQTDKSFYNDPWIDPVAKALYPRVRQALQQGESLYSERFLSDYLQICQQALGQYKAHPAPLLRTMAAAYTPDSEAAHRQFQRQLRTGSVWGSKGLGERAQQTFKNFKALSGSIFVLRSQLAQLQSWDLLEKSALKQIIRQPHDLVWGLQTSDNAYVFIFVAQQPAGFADLTERFLKQTTVFKGEMR